MRSILAGLTLLLVLIGFVRFGPMASDQPHTAGTSQTVPAEPSTSSTAALVDSTQTTQLATTLQTTTTTIVSTGSLPAGYSLAARSDQALPVFAGRGDPVPITILEATTMLGTPRVVQVLEGPLDGWARVALPIRPNGSQGWVQTEGLLLFVVDRRVVVDLSERSLRVEAADGLLLETTVAVGSDENPTPVGSFFVTDSVILDDPSGPWGPHAFGLSGYSDTISEFNGGDGIIGIHGTNQPDSIGHARSLGCVRVPNDVALRLSSMISAGVPVEIRP